MIVVEDGSGKTHSNAYCDAFFADDYFAARWNARWAGLEEEEEKEAALIRATDYIEGRFGGAFIGIRSTNEQALSWPRRNTAFTGIPERLKNACCEYAVRALDGPLAKDPVLDQAGYRLAATMQKVGPLQIAATVAGNGQPCDMGVYPEADMWLSGLLTSLNRTYR